MKRLKRANKKASYALCFMLDDVNILGKIVLLPLFLLIATIEFIFVLLFEKDERS